MIFFPLGVVFRFSLFTPRPYWITLTGPIFQKNLRDYFNEYGHFEKYGTKKKDKTL